MEHQRHFTYKLESECNVAVFTWTKTSPASFPSLLPFANQQSVSCTEHSAWQQLLLVHLLAVVVVVVVAVVVVVVVVCCWLLSTP